MDEIGSGLRQREGLWELVVRSLRSIGALMFYCPAQLFLWGICFFWAERAVAAPVDFSYVEKMAEELSRKPHQPPSVHSSLAGLSYDDYRMIRFNADKALWRGQALFEAQFFHLGFLFSVPVRIFEVDGEKVQEISYSRDFFTFDPRVEKKVNGTKIEKFAGLKITHPLHKADVYDDVAVFLGASYFRLVGREDQFGLSARGLAVDTAEPRGEEFPYFSHYWLVKPRAGDTYLTLYALLDSASVAGAYSFLIHPGQQTSVDCQATLYPRDQSRKMGIAPLTSMFLRGEADARDQGDYRPEVHDSDVLLMLTGTSKEWIVRPLIRRGEGVRVTRYLDINPKGFGLVQRDRRYENYLDLETHYENRPDFWIAPKGPWGAGSVELVEIASKFESNDNVVAYWVPQDTVDRPLKLKYRITAGRDAVNSDVAQVKRTLSQSLAETEFSTADEEKIARRYLVDFSGSELKGLGANQPLHPNLFLSKGSFRNLTIQKDELTGDWRVVFVAIRDVDTAVDMRLTLTLRGETLSETWFYLWDE
ncbi:MAG: glucan biosynthesis protein [Deltaproteobacteria bacterium]|nr:glucan biosynthesis protein [Deltaproteobacteria bacterium]